jgi:hypothetical protein
VIADWFSHDATFEYEYRSAEYEYEYDELIARTSLYNDHRMACRL